MTSDVIDWSAWKIAEAVGNREVSAVEVTNAFLDQINAVNPVINAVCTLNEQATAVASAC